MTINLGRFSFDEKDSFIVILGVFLFTVYLAKLSVAPFRFESLIVVFLFLLMTRSLIEINKFGPYMAIAMLGLLFSTFLSPYGLLIFYTIALFLYKKTNLI